MVKPDENLKCPSGTGLVTRTVRRKPQTFCKKGVKGFSGKDCADRSFRSFTITGDEYIDQKIIEGIETQFELCLEPTGTYFCRANLGIPRVDMPQFRGNILDRNSDIRKFLDSLLDEGVKIEERFVPVCYLKATQNQLEGKKIRGMIDTIRNAGGDLASPSVLPLVQPIIISKDFYVLDGHHRWAALLAWDFLNGRETVRLHVKMIDLPMEELYKRAMASPFVKIDTSYMGVK